MIRLIKVGGSCISSAEDTLREILVEFPQEKTIIVHGYSHTLRSILTNCGVSRRTFVSASGTPSQLTGETELFASILAAKLDNERLCGIVNRVGKCAHGILGHQGLMTGNRKKRIRYYDGATLKTVSDDRSGRFAGVHTGVLQQRLADCDVLVVGAILLGADHEPLVADADAVTSGLATALGVSNYLLLSDIPGLLVDGTVVPEVPKSKLPEYLRYVSGGMVKKLRYIEEALSNHVNEVVLRSAKASPNTQGTRFYADTNRCG
jgi:[amino group carrier protein]-L-2-aminoadipate 6-kinase